MERKRTKLRYSPELAGRMYIYFLSYEDSGAPSFAKFARSIGVTVEDLEGFRKHKRFDRAYRECSEIRRDYLIDRALTKRFDPTFVKYLLSLDQGGTGDGIGDDFTLKLEVSP